MLVKGQWLYVMLMQHGDTDNLQEAIYLARYGTRGRITLSIAHFSCSSC